MQHASELEILTSRAAHFRNNTAVKTFSTIPIDYLALTLWSVRRDQREGGYSSQAFGSRICTRALRRLSEVSER